LDKVNLPCCLASFSFLPLTVDCSQELCEYFLVSSHPFGRILATTCALPRTLADLLSQLPLSGLLRDFLRETPGVLAPCHAALCSQVLQRVLSNAPDLRRVTLPPPANPRTRIIAERLHVSVEQVLRELLISCRGRAVLVLAPGGGKQQPQVCLSRVSAALEDLSLAPLAPSGMARLMSVEEVQQLLGHSVRQLSLLEAANLPQLLLLATPEVFAKPDRLVYVSAGGDPSKLLAMPAGQLRAALPERLRLAPLMRTESDAIPSVVAKAPEPTAVAVKPAVSAAPVVALSPTTVFLHAATSTASRVSVPAPLAPLAARPSLTAATWTPDEAIATTTTAGTAATLPSAAAPISLEMVSAALLACRNISTIASSQHEATGVAVLRPPSSSSSSSS
jgi:hypothetical protein